MHRVLWLILCLTGVGCATQTGSPIEEPLTEPGPSSETDESGQAAPVDVERRASGDNGAEARSREVEFDENGRIDLQPAYDPERRVMPRPRRRMNIDQLRSAMVQVSGGIDWTENSGNRTRYLFDELSLTLGKPDFAETTDEELEPTVLFQKFLGDAARNICTRMALADEEGANGDDPSWTPRLLIHVGAEDNLITDPEAIKANMQSLLQRFHGRRLSVDAPGLSHWHWLFQSASFVTERPTTAWIAVCVGLFTHPDFFMY